MRTSASEIIRYFTFRFFDLDVARSNDQRLVTYREHRARGMRHDFVGRGDRQM
jgi:hypothetical protein